MTYQIYYTTKEEKNSRNYVLFDIEYYLKKIDNSENGILKFTVCHSLREFLIS